MKEIYLGKKEERKLEKAKIVVDRIPPKSTYRDRNRSDITMSETFQSPSEEASEKLYKSARKYFSEDKT